MSSANSYPLDHVCFFWGPRDPTGERHRAHVYPGVHESVAALIRKETSETIQTALYPFPRSHITITAPRGGARRDTCRLGIRGLHDSPPRSPEIALRIPPHHQANVSFLNLDDKSRSSCSVPWSFPIVDNGQLQGLWKIRKNDAQGWELECLSFRSSALSRCFRLGMCHP
ncbi:hypothetical protein NL676_016480 [Syzygium grande]|nr:hypothetical protein NL676_016480 [Syzygium grande]